MEKFEKVLDHTMSMMMSFVMLVLTVFATWQVFTRLILNDPSTFTEEIIRYLLIWASMIGAAYCFFKNKHIKLTVLTDRLGPKVNALLSIVSETVVLFFIGYVYIYGGIQMVAQNVAQLTAVLRIPMSIIYACIPLSGVLILMSKILQYLSRKRGSR